MDAVKPLNYAPRPPKSHRRLRRFYQFIVICSLIAAAYFWGPGAWRWAKFIYWQYQASRYLEPPTHIAFEATNMGPLTADKPLGFLPGTFFVHKLRRPDGTWRIVTMNALDVVGPPDARLPGAAYYLILPIGLRLNSKMELQFSSLPHASKDCKYFAGQPDPIDLSHFTFVYEADGKKYIVDCWLKNDDRLVVSPRP